MADIGLAEHTIRGLHTVLFEKVNNMKRDTRILDVACGSGAWIQRLSDAGFSNLVGIDVDTEQYQSSVGMCIKADVDIGEFGPPDGRYGLITAIEIIEHLANPGRFFTNVHEHLSDDGWLLLTTPNLHSNIARLRHLVTGRLQQFDGNSDPTHVYPIFLPCLRRALNRFDLEIDDLWTYPTGWGGLNSKWTSRLAARAVGLFIKDDLPGDILCMKIRRAQ